MDNKTKVKVAVVIGIIVLAVIFIFMVVFVKGNRNSKKNDIPTKLLRISTFLASFLKVSKSCEYLLTIFEYNCSNFSSNSMFHFDNPIYKMIESFLLSN